MAELISLTWAPVVATSLVVPACAFSGAGADTIDLGNGLTGDHNGVEAKLSSPSLNWKTQSCWNRQGHRRYS